jgi:hypothetical protein
LLLNKFEISLFLNALRIYEELSLIYLSLSLNQIGFSLGSRIGYCETGGADSLILRLKFPEVLIDFFILDFSLDLKTLEHAVCLLLKTHGLMLGCGFLGSSLDLKSHVHRFLQGFAGVLFNWVDGLDIYLSYQ